MSSREGSAAAVPHGQSGVTNKEIDARAAPGLFFLCCVVFVSVFVLDGAKISIGENDGDDD